MSDEPIESVEETEEVASEPLSVRAVNGIAKLKYWQHVEAIQGEGGPNYEAAFFAAQSEIESMIEADATAKVTSTVSTKYATLANLLARIRPILKKHELTIKQYPGRIHKLSSDTAKHLFMPICTTLRHVPSGEHETFVWEMPLVQLDAKALGSAATYGRRYAIVGIFGIASVDDDGAAAAIRNSIERNQGADVIDTLIVQIGEAKTTIELIKWLKQHRDGFDVLSEEKMEKIRDAYEKRKAALEEAETAKADVELVLVAKGRGKP